MAAINAIAFNGELMLFYHRKPDQGKIPMGASNAVRFKLICRIFSVVRRGEMFQKEYSKKAA